MFRNSQWLIATLAMFVIQIRGGMQGNVKPYFIRYYVAHDLTGFFAIKENFMALYMGLTMLAGVVGVFAANRLFLKLGWCKVTVMKTALLGSLVPNTLLLFVPRQWWEASLLLIMLGNFFHMMFLPLLFAACGSSGGVGAPELPKTPGPSVADAYVKSPVTEKLLDSYSIRSFAAFTVSKPPPLQTASITWLTSRTGLKISFTPYVSARLT